MWFLHADGPIGCVTVLKHEEVAKERLWTGKICLFSESRPEINGAAYRLLCLIIEIVAKRRADLRFGFNSSDQRPLTDNKEIPFFGWSEETRKFDGLLSENAAPRIPV
jgi:hypothetical protein